MTIFEAGDERYLNDETVGVAFSPGRHTVVNTFVGNMVLSNTPIDYLFHHPLVPLESLLFQELESCFLISNLWSTF